MVKYWINILNKNIFINKDQVYFDKKNIDFNFYSTSIIIGKIPKLPMQNSNVQLLKKLYNNLTIVLYVLAFVNFILLGTEKI